MRKKAIAWLLFAVGFLLCSYPLFSSAVEHHRQQKAIRTYENSVYDAEDLGSVLSEAEVYNQMLSQTNGAIVGDLENTVLGKENYETLLDISGSGIMGTIEIPKIQVDLPIYHGTEEEVLINGVGHLEGTALPVGGEGTRCVLTGHRGLPNSKLFTRLDELKKGDLFFLKICNKTLAYEIGEIKVIAPEEVEVLEPLKGRDQVSLVTCTPYGLNTHRMIVTGERTSYQEGEKQALKAVLPSWRELLFTVLPFVFLGVVIIPKVKERIKGNDESKKNDGSISINNGDS